jgi:aryl-alcohol dehydrogenase-like predicted oxidoreductase
VTTDRRLDRRDFLRSLAALSAAVTLPPHLPLFAGETPRSDALGELLPQRRLGRASESVTAFCLGGAHIEATMGRADAQRVIERSIELGCRFFDTAEAYGRGESERRFGEFLIPKYRKHVFVMTKTQARTAEAAERSLKESLERLGTDHLDLWQMHEIGSPEDVDARIRDGVLDVFLEAKKAGKSRYIGFTGHARPAAHLRMLERLKERGVELDTCQMPMNVVDPHYESFVLNVLPELVSRGYGVLAMKTLAFGQLLGKPTSWRADRKGGAAKVIGDRISIAEALGFVWSLPVCTVVSGVTNLDELEQNARICRDHPTLGAKEREALIAKVADFAGPAMEFYKA